MDAKWIVDLKGKQFVLYAGLLAEAHEKGLKAIETELIQVPSANNDNVAIAKAVVIMAEGETFTEWGDASPRNVARHLIEATIRMALTRAKARALRDAISVGETCLEELDQEADAPANGKARAHAAVTAAETQEVSARVSRPAPPPPKPAADPAPGFEPWFEVKGQRKQRVSLISAYLTDVGLAQEYGLRVEALEPEATPNEQLWMFGKALRGRLKEAKEARETAKAAAQAPGPPP